MQQTPQLRASTKEIWAGVRSPGSATSGIQNAIAEIQARLSGIDAYQSFLDQSSVDSFDSYESELQAEASDLVSDDTVAETRQIVAAEFQDFDSFTGDSGNNTGIFGLNTYDGYRTYLINNGVDNVDADRHSATIQDIFQPDRTFIEAVLNDLTTYGELETYLTNNGFAQEDASDLVAQLKERFPNFGDLESFLQNNTSLDVLLSEYEHNEGVRGVEYDDNSGTLYLRAENEIRMEQTNAVADDDPEPPADSDISPLSGGLSPTAVTIGEAATVQALFENSGSADGTITATLSVNGERASSQDSIVVAGSGSKSVSIPAGEQRTVSFEVSPAAIGSYDLQINDAPSSTLTADFA